MAIEKKFGLNVSQLQQKQDIAQQEVSKQKALEIQKRYDAEQDAIKKYKIGLESIELQKQEAKRLLSQGQPERKFMTRVSTGKIQQYEQAKSSIKQLEKQESESKQEYTDYQKELAKFNPEQAEPQYVDQAYSEAQSKLQSQAQIYQDRIDTANKAIEMSKAIAIRDKTQIDLAFIEGKEDDIYEAQKTLQAIQGQLGQDKITLVKNYFSGYSNKLSEQAANLVRASIKRRATIRIENKQTIADEPIVAASLGLTLPAYQKMKSEGMLPTYISKVEEEQKAIKEEYDRLQKVIPEKVYRHNITGELILISAKETPSNLYYVAYATPSGEFIPDIVKYIKENKIPITDEITKPINIQEFKEAITPSYYQAITPLPSLSKIESFIDSRKYLPSFIEIMNKQISIGGKQSIFSLITGVSVPEVNLYQIRQKAYEKIEITKQPTLLKQIEEGAISFIPATIGETLITVAGFKMGSLAYKVLPKTTTSVIAGTSLYQYSKAEDNLGKGQALIGLGFAALGTAGIVAKRLNEPIDIVKLKPKDIKFAITNVQPISEKVSIGKFTIYAEYKPRLIEYDTRINKFMRQFIIDPEKISPWQRQIAEVSKTRYDELISKFIIKDKEMLATFEYTKSTRPNQKIIGRIIGKSDDISLQQADKLPEQYQELLKLLFEKETGIPTSLKVNIDNKEVMIAEKLLSNDFIYSSAQLETAGLTKITKTKTGYKIEPIFEKQELKMPKLIKDTGKIFKFAEKKYVLIPKEERFDIITRGSEIERIGIKKESILSETKLSEDMKEKTLYGEIIGKERGKRGDSIFLRDITRIKDYKEPFIKYDVNGEKIIVDENIASLSKTNSNLQLQQKKIDTFVELRKQLSQMKIQAASIMEKPKPSYSKAIENLKSDIQPEYSKTISKTSGSLFALREIQLVKTIMASEQKTMTNEVNKSINRSIEKLTEKTINKEVPREVSKTINKEVQKEIERTMQKELQKITQKTIQREIPKSILPIVPFIFKLPTESSPPLKLRISDSEKIRSREKQQAYNVKVIQPAIKGETKRQVVKANTKPLTKQSALDMGSYASDTSLAARFKIEPVKGKPSQAPANIPKGYYNVNANKFREFKVRKGQKISTPLVFIEKSRNRLDTPQEVSKITAAKRVAQIKKSGGKVGQSMVDYAMSM